MLGMPMITLVPKVEMARRIAELEAELTHEQESNHISIEQWGIWQQRAEQAEAKLAALTEKE